MLLLAPAALEETEQPGQPRQLVTDHQHLAWPQAALDPALPGLALSRRQRMLGGSGCGWPRRRLGHVAANLFGHAPGDFIQQLGCDCHRPQLGQRRLLAAVGGATPWMRQSRVEIPEVGIELALPVETRSRRCTRFRAIARHSHVQRHAEEPAYAEYRPGAVEGLRAVRD